MSVIEDITKENLKQFGIEGFGFTMPAMSPKWVDQNSTNPSGITFNAGNLSLTLSGSQWLSPFTCVSQITNNTDKKINTSLQFTDGSMVNENGIFMRLFTQQVLRLKRLVRNQLEDNAIHNPQFGNFIPLRQVPAYLFLKTSADLSSVQGGMIQAKTNIGFDGELFFFDEQGYVLHPLYVAGLCKRLLIDFPILSIDSSLNNQLDAIIDLEATPSTSVRLIQADGSASDSTHLTGLTDAGNGLYQVDSFTGSDTTLKGQIKREDATDDYGTFPPKEAQLFLICNVTYGRFSDTVNIPKLKDLDSDTSTSSLKHDFFTIKVLQLNRFLLGSPNADFNGSKFEPRPVVRVNEQLRFLDSGNKVLGKFNTIFSGSPSKNMMVATQIQTTFTLPSDENNAEWPVFPPLPSGFVADDADYPSNFKQQLEANGDAHFINAATPPACDVLLHLVGVPKGAAIHVFNRTFLQDAVIQRGEGSGTVVVAEVVAASGRTFNGEAFIVLKDPLGMIRSDGTFTVPGNPTLICDIMIVPLNETRKRLFGALTFAVQNPAVDAPALPPANVINTISPKGICNAGILGLNTSSPSFSLTTIQDVIKAAFQFGSEPQPRDAHRLPTMMRKELVATALKTNGWQSLLGSGPCSVTLHNHKTEIGLPGSSSGSQSASYGVFTQDARLAYDIARAAFRRSTHFYDRLDQLTDAAWNEPSGNSALGETDTPTDSIGTFAGAILQTISPYCETPELALLKTLVENNISSIPQTFDDLIDKVVEWIDDLDLSGLTSPLDTAATRLKTEVKNKLNDLKDNNDLNESDKERVFNEIKRELSASCFGRRDTQWALQQAIQQARDFIYIETPGISFTEGNHENYSFNFWSELQTQLTNKPGLRVILCVPKYPEYQKKYDQWIRSEIKERFTLINSLPQQQVVCFHPIGFPGMPLKIENNIVIVDDQWALFGSSSMRRRGFVFDGSTDLVFTDVDHVHGKSSSIKAIRKRLLQERLGIDKSATINSKQVMLEQPHDVFRLIREMLIAGGLGKIERLFNGHVEGIPFSEPTIDRLVANPEGLEFSGIATLLNLVIADLTT